MSGLGASASVLEAVLEDRRFTWIDESGLPRVAFRLGPVALVAFQEPHTITHLQNGVRDGSELLPPVFHIAHYELRTSLVRIVLDLELAMFVGDCFAIEAEHLHSYDACSNFCLRAGPWCDYVGRTWRQSPTQTLQHWARVRGLKLPSMFTSNRLPPIEAYQPPKMQEAIWGSNATNS